jgi:hypothetical protein
MHWVTRSRATTDSAHGRRGKRFPQGKRLQTQIVHVVLLVSVCGIVPQSPEACSFELEYRSNSREDLPFPWGIPCYNGVVPTQTGGQLWSVLDSFLPPDPCAKDTVARNNCRIERQPRPSTRHARGFDLSANGLIRHPRPRGLYRENFIEIISQRGSDRSLNSRAHVRHINAWIIAQYGMTRVEVENVMDNDWLH